MYSKGLAGGAAAGVVLAATGASNTSEWILATGIVLIVGSLLVYGAAWRRRAADRRSAG